MHHSNWNSRVLNIWRFLDGRPGHENQVLGLSEAIVDNHAARVFDIRIHSRLRGLSALIPGRFRFAESLPPADLLIGAGHSTHVPLLVCQKRFGGKTVVIMKPSLPIALFDLCLVPAHDKVRFPASNVVRTQGALNRIRPSQHKDNGCGLILVGGPSRHFRWSDSAVIRQLQSVIQHTPLRWTIATSDRTPASFLNLCKSVLPDMSLVTPQTSTPHWLPAQLAEAGTVWVTCDSMSMIYEALTAGSSVGLLELDANNRGRIVRCVQRLSRASLATSWSDWRNGRSLPTGVLPFSESNRCSVEVLRHCLSTSTADPPGFPRLGVAGLTQHHEKNFSELESLVTLMSRAQVPAS